MNVITTEQFRIDEDALGDVHVPAKHLWGAQTQRDTANPRPSDLRMGGATRRRRRGHWSGRKHPTSATTGGKSRRLD